MKKRNKLLILAIIVFALYLASSSLRAEGEAISGSWSSAKITDISDRKYEDAVVQLLDSAKESIVISMYSISLGTETKNPVKLLLNDLLEARVRGVSVTLYLNTRFRNTGKTEGSFIESPVFKELKDAGCNIHLMPSSRRLHDKLIIVDKRYVVEGSTNWSIAALRTNFESNTLIDSPRHAEEKLNRLEKVLDFVKSNSKISDTPGYSEELPEELSVPKELLTNKKYFSRMVTSQDNRAFDLYLLLLAHSQLAGEDEFFINLEDMALSLGLPDTWDYTALRRQVIKSLKRLQKRYNLITVKFLHGKDASVKLTDFPEGSFAVSSDSIIQVENPELSMRLKFLLLVEALLKDEGKDLYSMSQPALAKRFNLHQATIHAAFRDLRNYKK